uniref:Uncharacterized protein n=1 Tax=Romanomermis culicivorax TaxID=13658 RepID=A0A915JV01_ROMCU
MNPFIDQVVWRREMPAEVIAENTTKSVWLLEKLTSCQISEQEPTIIAIENENVILNENSKISETNGHMTEP